jgi:hypothetical protein
VAEWGDHLELRVHVAAYRVEVPAACQLDDRQQEVLDEWWEPD